MQPERWALVGGEIITPWRRISHGVIAGTGTTIDFIEARVASEELDGRTVRDVTGQIVAPGFVDIHVHGGDGTDFMDGSLDAFEAVCACHARYGTTSLAPTTVASTMEVIIETLKVARAAMDRRMNGAQVLGVHIEGPWFAVDKKGAHDRVWNPREEEWTALLPWAHVIRRLTLAPELPGALAATRALVGAGIVVCAGHTDATYAEMVAAIEQGLSHVTHLWNQASIVTRDGPYRRGGCVEAALLEDDLTVELIADGHHLPPELMRLALKCKGLDKVCVITDAMRGAGMPDGTSWTVGPRSSNVTGIVRNGVAFLPDNSAFASSVTTMDAVVRNAVQLIGLALPDAIRVATLSPAQILGVADRKGSLAAGKDADIVILDQNLQVLETIVLGRSVYQREPVSSSATCRLRSVGNG